MTQSNIASEFKYVCACGGGCRSLEYLDRHIATAADPTKTTWYSIDGIWQLFGLPEGTHGRIGDKVPHYNTRMGAADFQANVAQWKAFLAERGVGKAVEPNTSPDGICVALTKSTGLRCDRRAGGGTDICRPHTARPGRGRIVVHPSMVGQVQAPTGVHAPTLGQDGFPTPPQAPAPASAPAGALPAPDAVAQGLAAIMQKLEGFDSRLTQIESGATEPSTAPVEPEETLTPISKLLAKLGAGA